MIQDKEKYRILHFWTLPYFSLLLFLGLINLVFTEFSFGDRSEILISKTYPVNTYKPDISIFGTLNEKWNLHDELPTIKHSGQKTNSQPLSDPCVLKEYHKGFADKGPEPDMLAFSGVYISHSTHVKSFICHLLFSTFSSWTGFTLKIRPPPFL